VISGTTVAEDGAPVATHQENGSHIVEIGSGTYHFDVK